MAVAVVAFVSTSYGWFAYNKTTEGNDMSITLVGNQMLLIDEYRIYKRDEENKVIKEVSNNIDGDPLYNKRVSLNEYDTILKERNAGTHIVISVVIGHIVEGGTIVISISNNNPIDAEHQSDALEAYLSNICSFRCKYGLEEDDIETAFGSFNSETETYPYSQFVTVTNTETNGEVTWINTKADSIEMTISNYDGAIYTVTENGNEVKKLRVYIEISYNEDLVTNYLSQNGESTDFNDVSNNEVEFRSDMKPFIFDYVLNQ